MKRIGLSWTARPDGLYVPALDTTLHLVRWEADDADCPGLPARQTLERLVCSALHTVYPERTAAVARWLDSRPGASAYGGKEFAWSHMAGWYAEDGCERFYRTVWEDVQVASQLEKRLRSNGSWAVVEAIAA